MSDTENAEIEIDTTVAGTFSSRIQFQPTHRPVELARLGSAEDGRCLQMYITEPATKLSIYANGVIELNDEMVNDEPEKVVKFLEEWGRLVVPEL